MDQINRKVRKFERKGVIFLIYKDGKVLLEHRTTPDKAYFGYEIIPGGKVEQTDISAVKAAEREAFEECGIVVKKMAHLDTFLHVTISNHLYQTAAFLITEFEGELKNNEGKSEHIWVDINETSKHLQFADSRYVIRLALNFLARDN